MNPNWTTATTTLDTTPYGDQYLVFWVMVVLKDAQGNPVSEMPAHGLTGIPPTLNSIAEATQWTEPYSNNVGFYKSTFYVAPPSTHAAAATAASAATPRISLDDLKLSKTKALLGDKVIVNGMFHSKTDMDGFSVLLSDGKKKSNLFDVEEVSHIRANDAFLIKTVYDAASCGDHTLTMTALKGKVHQEATLNVTINAKQAVKQMSKELKALGLKQGRANTLGELLREAKKALKQNDTKSALDALRLLQERIQALGDNKLPPDSKDLLLHQVSQFLDCVK